jgi:hypothetical protein
VLTTDFNETARRLRNAVEPVAAGVYFAPEAHAAYAVLGFDGSPITQPRRACAGPPCPSQPARTRSGVEGGYNHRRWPAFQPPG